ncbi:MAG TPA: alkaline phosphatase family protein [Candidatus Tumulicola sp.]|nr:alkaline phosphatase family protein [Candidatus Tumulicola sp.]
MRSDRFSLKRILAVAAAAASLGACAGGGNETAGGLPSAPNAGSFRVDDGPMNLLRQKIKHVVIIVQENRSFDNLFQGFPGADTQSYGYTSGGQQVALQSVGLETSWDIVHDLSDYLNACDGSGSIPGTNCKMDGFDKEYAGCGHRYQPPCPIQFPEYAFVPANETKPYFAMGEQYVVADRMFTSNLDGSSFISHQYIIGAQASSAVDYPSGAWGCDGGPSDMVHTITQQRQYGPQESACFDNQTLGDELDKAGVSWHYYATAQYGQDFSFIWSAYQAIKHIYNGPDWSADVISPQTQIINDAQNGKLPAVSWVTPTCANSDHAGCGSNTGPAWVASVVNAIGQSQYWNSTAIFLMWDDYGGWYDHVSPPYEDYDGLGIRVPLVIISPFAKKAFVSHVQYEHGSILRFVEDVFGLPRLSASDTRANSPAKDCFNFARLPRKFHVIPSSHDAQFFLHQPPDPRPVDTQ